MIRINPGRLRGLLSKLKGSLRMRKAGGETVATSPDTIVLETGEDGMLALAAYMEDGSVSFCRSPKSVRGGGRSFKGGGPEMLSFLSACGRCGKISAGIEYKKGRLWLDRGRKGKESVKVRKVGPIGVDKLLSRPKEKLPRIKGKVLSGLLGRALPGPGGPEARVLLRTRKDRFETICGREDMISLTRTGGPGSLHLRFGLSRDQAGRLCSFFGPSEEISVVRRKADVSFIAGDGGMTFFGPDVPKYPLEKTVAAGRSLVTGEVDGEFLKGLQDILAGGFRKIRIMTDENRLVMASVGDGVGEAPVIARMVWLYEREGWDDELEGVFSADGLADWAGLAGAGRFPGAVFTLLGTDPGVFSLKRLREKDFVTAFKALEEEEKEEKKKETPPGSLFSVSH